MLKPQARSSKPSASYPCSLHIPDTEADSAAKGEIDGLANRLFQNNSKKRKAMISRIWVMYSQTHNKDFLVIHSPGGWGSIEWDGIQAWEKSIVTGVTSTLENLHYSYVMKQYFRSGNSWYSHMKDFYKETRFFFWGISDRAEVFAEELKLIVQLRPRLNVILVGASQGAAFNNAAMMRLGDVDRICSIELGTFFPQMKRRVLTDRNLAIDNNGFMPDPMSQRDLWVGFKAYLGAFGRWSKLRLQGHHIKFTDCINAPGHEYKWEYPAVSGKITEYLSERFGMKPS